MTQTEWIQLESTIARMSDEEKARLSRLLDPQKPASPTSRRNRSLGLFADEPALIDEIMEGVYHAREHHPLRIEE